MSSEEDKNGKGELTEWSMIATDRSHYKGCSFN